MQVALMDVISWNRTTLTVSWLLVTLYSNLIVAIVLQLAPTWREGTNLQILSKDLIKVAS